MSKQKEKLKLMKLLVESNQTLEKETLKIQQMIDKEKGTEEEAQPPNEDEQNKDAYADINNEPAIKNEIPPDSNNNNDRHKTENDKVNLGEEEEDIVQQQNNKLFSPIKKVPTPKNIDEQQKKKKKEVLKGLDKDIQESKVNSDLTNNEDTQQRPNNYPLPPIKDKRNRKPNLNFKMSDIKGNKNNESNNQDSFVNNQHNNSKPQKINKFDTKKNSNTLDDDLDEVDLNEGVNDSKPFKQSNIGNINDNNNEDEEQQDALDEVDIHNESNESKKQEVEDEEEGENEPKNQEIPDEPKEQEVPKKTKKVEPEPDSFFDDNQLEPDEDLEKKKKNKKSKKKKKKKKKMKKNTYQDELDEDMDVQDKEMDEVNNELDDNIEESQPKVENPLKKSVVVNKSEDDLDDLEEYEL